MAAGGAAEQPVREKTRCRLSNWPRRRDLNTTSARFQLADAATELAHALLQFVQLDRADHEQGNRHQQNYQSKANGLSVVHNSR